MGKQLASITPELQHFIENQKIFFVGTAAAEGRVNISPKGLDSLRVLGPNQVVWLNLTGSGNETAAHLMRNDRMTLMFCAFEGDPKILRLYGKSKIFHKTDEEFTKLLEKFPPNPGARQIILMEVDLVQTSCGYAVPLMAFQGEREILTKWADKKGEDGIEEYWHKKNARSIDGFETEWS